MSALFLFGDLDAHFEGCVVLFYRKYSENDIIWFNSVADEYMIWLKMDKERLDVRRVFFNIHLGVYLLMEFAICRNKNHGLNSPSNTPRRFMPSSDYSKL